MSWRTGEIASSTEIISYTSLMSSLSRIVINRKGIEEFQMEATLMPGSQHRFLFNPETLFVPAAGYSQVAEIRSVKLIYIAGQVPFDKSGNLVGKDDFLAQAEQVFRNIKAAIEAAGGSFSDVLKLNYFCVERPLIFLFCRKC
jgi:enamine deaminase RidA (YjgF/YER057c/UK114 family)